MREEKMAFRVRGSFFSGIQGGRADITLIYKELKNKKAHVQKGWHILNLDIFDGKFKGRRAADKIADFNNRFSSHVFFKMKYHTFLSTKPNKQYF